MTISMLFSCQTKSDDIKPSQTIVSREQFTRDLYQKYDHDNYIKWQKLNQLLANDLISAKELGVIDCRGFDKHSAELSLKQDFIYNILDEGYSWGIYQTKKGNCVELQISRIGAFFLSVKEARVLLSASKGYHFERLGLELPTITYKRTVLRVLKDISCGDSYLDYKEDTTVISDACKEIILYGKPEENPKMLIYTPFNPNKQPSN